VADRLEHCAEQDRHVVTIAGTKLQHPPWRVQHFHAMRVLGVPHVPLDPLEQRFQLAEVVLGPHPA
jgi:hypothetical protein